MASFLFWSSIVFVGYTYVGYPAILWFLTRNKKKRNSGLGEPKSVSIIIAAYNEEKVIEKKIENTLGLEKGPQAYEIIVAADGSTDRTVELAEKYQDQGVKISFLKQRAGKVSAINRAVAQASGEIIVFSDANNIYSPNAILELCKHYDDSSVGAVTGEKRIMKGDGVLGDSEGLYWKYESFIKKAESALNTCTGAVGEILSIRKNVFSPIPAQVINDDFYIIMKVIQKGFRVAYEPEARSFEQISLTAKDEQKRRVRIIEGRYQAFSLVSEWFPKGQPTAVWQIVSHKLFRPIVPITLIIALVSSGINLLIPPPNSFPDYFLLPKISWLIIFLTQLIFYILAIIGNTVNLESLGKWIYLPTYFFNSNLAALQGLVRFVFLNQSPIWDRVNRRG